MAQIQNPILGRASGKLSMVELYSANGKNYVRSAKLKQYKPQNETQIKNYKRFSFVANHYAQIGLNMKTMFGKPQKGISYLNYFIQKNILKYEINNSYNVFCFDVPSFVFFNKQTKHGTVFGEPFVEQAKVCFEAQGFYPLNKSIACVLAVRQYGKAFQVAEVAYEVLLPNTFTITENESLFGGYSYDIFFLQLNQDTMKILYCDYAGFFDSPK